MFNKGRFFCHPPDGHYPLTQEKGIHGQDRQPLRSVLAPQLKAHMVAPGHYEGPGAQLAFLWAFTVLPPGAVGGSTAHRRGMIWYYSFSFVKEGNSLYRSLAFWLYHSFACSMLFSACQKGWHITFFPPSSPHSPVLCIGLGDRRLSCRILILPLHSSTPPSLFCVAAEEVSALSTSRSQSQMVWNQMVLSGFSHHHLPNANSWPWAVVSF